MNKKEKIIIKEEKDIDLTLTKEKIKKKKIEC